MSLRFVDEFRDAELGRAVAEQILSLVEPGRHYKLMEVCGGHTHSIYKYGVDDLLPVNVELVHGPGCPVCVIPMGRVDDGIALAHEEGDRGSWARLIGDPDGRSGGADGIREGRGDVVGSESVVVTDQNALAGIFAAHDVTRDRVRYDARIGESEILSDDAAPAIRSKANGSHRG